MRWEMATTCSLLDIILMKRSERLAERLALLAVFERGLQVSQVQCSHLDEAKRSSQVKSGRIRSS